MHRILSGQLLPGEVMDHIYPLGDLGLCISSNRCNLPKHYTISSHASPQLDPAPSGVSRHPRDVSPLAFGQHPLESNALDGESFSCVTTLNDFVNPTSAHPPIHESVAHPAAILGMVQLVSVVYGANTYIKKMGKKKSSRNSTCVEMMVLKHGVNFAPTTFLCRTVATLRIYTPCGTSHHVPPELSQHPSGVSATDRPPATGNRSYDAVGKI